jgi:hypothetical protein
LVYDVNSTNRQNKNTPVDKNICIIFDNFAQVVWKHMSIINKWNKQINNSFYQPSDVELHPYSMFRDTYSLFGCTCRPWSSTVETLWPHFETLKLSEKSSAACFRPSSSLKLECCQQFPVARCKTFPVELQGLHVHPNNEYVSLLIITISIILERIYYHWHCTSWKSRVRPNLNSQLSVSDY